MTLHEITKQLLRTPDVATWLSMADNYIRIYNRMPDRFVLPAQHAKLKPIIEAFATNTDAFSEYIRAMRDSCTGPEYDKMHKLYRKVSVRALQVVRRNRVRKAMMVLLPSIEAELDRRITYDEQLKAGSIIDKAWGARRLKLQADERVNLKSKRLTVDDRAVLLDAYWTHIDKSLEKGVVILDREDVLKIIEELKK